MQQNPISEEDHQQDDQLDRNDPNQVTLPEKQKSFREIRIVYRDACVIPSAMPRNIENEARVTTSGGRPNLEIRNPFKAPPAHPREGQSERRGTAKDANPGTRAPKTDCSQTHHGTDGKIDPPGDDHGCQRQSEQPSSTLEPDALRRSSPK